jgi:hypothetical protein
VLGVLLVLRVWLPPTFNGIDPEQAVSQRYKNRQVQSELIETNGRT